MKRRYHPAFETDPIEHFKFEIPPSLHSRKVAGDRQAATHYKLQTTNYEPRMADPLIARLKVLIVDTLKLDDVRPEDISDDEPLIGTGLNLDSIDALELVVKLEKEFGIKITNSEQSRAALASVVQLAAFIRAQADPGRLPA
jgi:acyl carrier protein